MCKIENFKMELQIAQISRALNIPETTQIRFKQIKILHFREHPSKKLYSKTKL